MRLPLTAYLQVERLGKNDLEDFLDIDRMRGGAENLNMRSVSTADSHCDGPKARALPLRIASPAS